jgi:polygalacturonase
MELNVHDFGAAGDGRTLDTKSFQDAINQAAAAEGTLIVPAGKYLLGSIFLKSGVHFQLEAGAELLGSTELQDYPQIETRVAGIEMQWPAALVNVIDASNVTISGAGTIDGCGECWWDLYWGHDGKGGRRKYYDERQLRWVADYEIQRPRLILVQNSSDIVLKDFLARRAGFWTIQLTYCRDVRVQGVSVRDNDGPSTDGIDIDSCRKVCIEDCVIACNDDDIVIKSGRDSDGLRVNRVCEDILIQNCQIYSGAGITIGSEVSGGVRNVTIRNNRFENTDCGFRIKSSRLRGGFIEQIQVENLQMHNVQFPFSWLLDWHPAYNTFILPVGDVPEYWKRLAAPVPQDQQYTAVRGISVRHVSSTYGTSYTKHSRAFDLQGAVMKPMAEIKFQDIDLRTSEYGIISGVADLHFRDVRVSAPEGNDRTNDTYDQR